MGKRLLQIFLSSNPTPAIFEVHTTDKKDITCSCPGYIAKASCKHTKLVASRIDDFDGTYPFDFVREVSPSEITEALKDESAFREFVIKNARAEAI